MKWIKSEDEVNFVKENNYFHYEWFKLKEKLMKYNNNWR